MQFRCISSPSTTSEHLARLFVKLMFEGNTKVALCLPSEQNKGGWGLGVFHLHVYDPIETGNGERKVRNILGNKHHLSQPVHPDTIIDDDLPDIYSVLFGCHHDALDTRGAAGPSVLDALGWRRLCTRTSSKLPLLQLCYSLALAAIHLYMKLADPTNIVPLVASCLIALDKNHCICPIGYGQTYFCQSHLNQTSSGKFYKKWLCAGQTAGIEAVVHAIRAFFQSKETGFSAS